jgi:hypothetical protein
MCHISQELCHFKTSCMWAPVSPSCWSDEWWAVMQQVVIIPYQHFGTSCQSQPHGSSIQEVALFCGKVESFCPKEADFYSHIVQYFDSRLGLWEKQELFNENFFVTCTRSDTEAWYVCKLVPQVLKSPHFARMPEELKKPNWRYIGWEVRSFTPLWKV